MSKYRYNTKDYIWSHLAAEQRKRVMFSRHPSLIALCKYGVAEAGEESVCKAEPQGTFLLIRVHSETGTTALEFTRCPSQDVARIRANSTVPFLVRVRFIFFSRIQ